MCNSKMLDSNEASKWTSRTAVFEHSGNNGLLKQFTGLDFWPGRRSCSFCIKTKTNVSSIAHNYGVIMMHYCQNRLFGMHSS